MPVEIEFAVPGRDPVWNSADPLTRPEDRLSVRRDPSDFEADSSGPRVGEAVREGAEEINMSPLPNSQGRARRTSGEAGLSHFWPVTR
jgi:hypothetical protein